MNKNNLRNSIFPPTPWNQEKRMIEDFKKSIEKLIKICRLTYPEDFLNYFINLLTDTISDFFERTSQAGRPVKTDIRFRVYFINYEKEFLKNKNLNKIKDDYRKLIYGIYSENIHDLKLELPYKIKIGNLFMKSIENFNQIENIDFNKTGLKFINFINKKNEELEKKFIETEISGKYLIWNKYNLGTLENISKELHDQEYTENKLDFEHVFTKRKVINWKKDIIFLRFLIDELFYHPRKLILVSHDKKGIFKVAQRFFRDLSKAKPRSFSFANRMYRYRKKSGYNEEQSRVPAKKLIQKFI